MLMGHTAFLSNGACRRRYDPAALCATTSGSAVLSVPCITAGPSGTARENDGNGDPRQPILPHPFLACVLLRARSWGETQVLHEVETLLSYRDAELLSHLKHEERLMAAEEAHIAWSKLKLYVGGKA